MSLATVTPPESTSTSHRVAVAIGDPNGIGPEIAVRAAVAVSSVPHVARPLLVGDAWLIEHCCQALALGPAERAGFDIHDVPALARTQWAPGEVHASAGAATVAYVRAALDLWREGRVAAVAACPHSETAVNAAGIAFSGYGPLVADLTDTPRDEVFLMLVAQGLRVAHLTVHERLLDAVQRITPTLVEAGVHATCKALRRMGVREPRVCVLGINPHAGEDGLFGDDDERITRPAVQALWAQGVAVDGPVGADLALSEQRHDGYVAMFHDQGHIAVKMLSPKGASAVLAGPPVLFSSVGHGAAFNIANQFVADSTAMTATLQLLAETA